MLGRGYEHVCMCAVFGGVLRSVAGLPSLPLREIELLPPLCLKGACADVSPLVDEPENKAETSPCSMLNSAKARSQKLGDSVDGVSLFHTICCTKHGSHVGVC